MHSFNKVFTFQYTIGISQQVENIMYHSIQHGQPDIDHPSPVSTLLPDVGSDNAGIVFFFVIMAN